MIASMLTLSREEFHTLGKHQDEYTIHKLVYSLFPGSARKFLYLDKFGDFSRRQILIVSREEPGQPEVGSLETKVIPEDFLTSRYYAFEVRLNPIKRVNGNKRMIPVIGSENLENWFLHRQDDWGFTASPRQLEVFDTGIQRFTKGSTEILHNKATFRGVLQVTDKEKFYQAFSYGIGRGKAFGFGLLQLQPLHNTEGDENYG